MRRRIRGIAAVAAAGLLLLAWVAPSATGQQPEQRQGLADSFNPEDVLPESQTVPPPGFAISAEVAIGIADQTPEVRRERRLHPGMKGTAYIPTYFSDNRWIVHYVGDGRDLAQVHVQGYTGEVLEAWTDIQVNWIMARGYEGQFGERLNAPYVWLPLALLFLLPFFDPRRPWRLLHFDLLVLLSFGVSQAFYNGAHISTSVALSYPPLLYLLARMLWIGLKGLPDGQRLVPVARTSWLAAGIVVLALFRIALNVADSDVVDVGYAGVVGADRVVRGFELYTDNRYHPDAYGPFNYLAYVPFELAFPWSGKWDDLPAAHAAAIVFDLLVLIGLLVLGRSLSRSDRLGLALGFAWMAYPYSAMPLMANTNDSLVAAALVWTLVALRSPPARGVLLALGASAKFAPAVLLPLVARGAGRLSVRAVALACACFAAVVTAVFAPFVPDGGVREIWDATVGYQAARESPFSVWGQVSGLEWALTGVKALAVCLALALAFVPRERGTVQVAALGAALLIVLQLAATHWFYLYLAWFAPLALVALLAGNEAAGRVQTPRIR